ncbi:hypothetical protein BT63DRAFT_419784 [Microthyrium microscopicum]|uniref:Glyoxalase-like domain-containing protein n=1 Tax=Microthyrium microscopicum TaxID=703497 RepID=A0A6A6UU86_9PEZI|nr:hypothetical protein BT63DRAFT_419784 [Microthyrium microscopicum]
MSENWPTGPPKPTRLRQLCFVTRYPDRDRFLLTKVLNTSLVFDNGKMENWGLMNAVVPIGGDFIELVWPTRPDASGARFLTKLQADCAGYMLILQTRDALKRRKAIEAAELGRILWTNGDKETSFASQYDPRVVKGNVMPELDTMWPSKEFPEMLDTAVSPWHGFPGDFGVYSKEMRRTAHMKIAKVTFRLKEGDDDILGAVKGWRDIFGVPLVGTTSVFTNATMEFLPGEKGRREGLESVTITVEGKKDFEGILKRASEEGLCGDGWINLCGVKWYFVYAGEGSVSKL